MARGAQKGAGSKPGILDGYCAVCDNDGEDGPDDEDPLVSCKSCGLLVHVACYGASYLCNGKGKSALDAAIAKPAGALLCALCQSDRGKHDTPPCLLCGYANCDNRAMKEISSSPKSDNDLKVGSPSKTAQPGKKRAKPAGVDEGWAHVVCVQYVQGPGFEDEEERDGVAGLGFIDKARWGLRCLLCAARGQASKADEVQAAFHAQSRGKGRKKGSPSEDPEEVDPGLASLMTAFPYATPHGAPVQCSHGSCFVAFHPLCARAAGWTISMEEVGDDLRMRTYCGAHSADKDLAAAAVNEVPCGGCGGYDRPGDSLLCDGCDATVHFDCLPHPLPGVPWYDWYCGTCVEARVPAGTLVCVPLGPVPAGAAAAASSYSAAGQGRKRGTQKKAGAGSRGSSGALPAAWPSVRYVKLSAATLGLLPLPSAVAAAREGNNDGAISTATGQGGSHDGAGSAASRGGVALGGRGKRGLAAVAPSSQAVHSDDEDDDDEDDGDGDESGDVGSGSDDDDNDGNNDGENDDDGDDGFTRGGRSGGKKGKGKPHGAMKGALKRGKGAASSSAAVKSSRAADLSEAPPFSWIPLTEVQKRLDAQPPKHQLAAAALMHNHVRSFPEWTAYLRAGFGLLLYGFGSKTELSRSFVAHAAPSARVLEVCGYSHLLTLRAVLEALSQQAQALAVLHGRKAASAAAPGDAPAASGALAPGKRVRKRALLASELPVATASLLASESSISEKEIAAGTLPSSRGGGGSLPFIEPPSLSVGRKRGRLPNSGARADAGRRGSSSAAALGEGDDAAGLGSWDGEDGDEEDVNVPDDGAPPRAAAAAGGAAAGAAAVPSLEDDEGGLHSGFGSLLGGLPPGGGLGAGDSDADNGHDDDDEKEEGDNSDGEMAPQARLLRWSTPPSYVRWLSCVRAASRARLACWPAPVDSDSGSSSDEESSDDESDGGGAPVRARRRVARRKRRAAAAAAARSSAGVPGVRLVVLVRGIDGPAFRGPGAVSALVRAVCAVPGARLVGTSDHVNAPLLFDSGTVERGQLLWLPATTFARYPPEELAWTGLGQGRDTGAASTKTGLLWLLRSLTPALVKIVRLILDAVAPGGEGAGASSSSSSSGQRTAADAGSDDDDDDDGDGDGNAAAGSKERGHRGKKGGSSCGSSGGGGYGSLRFDALLDLCRENLVLHTDTHLRQHLVELHDHELTAGRGARIVLLTPPEKLREALDAHAAG